MLVRHAQSESNESLITSSDGLYYSNSGCDPAVKLTSVGIQQAKQAGQRLARLFPSERPLKRVYLNDFERVRSTVAEIEKQLPYSLRRVTDLRLNKRNYGLFWNMTRPGVKQLYPEEWQRYLLQGELLYRPPENGENYLDHFARVDDFIDEHVLSSTEDILIVTHSLTVLAFRRRLEGLSDQQVVRLYEEMAVPNASLIVYCIEPDGTLTVCDEKTLSVKRASFCAEDDGWLRLTVFVTSALYFWALFAGYI